MTGEAQDRPEPRALAEQFLRRTGAALDSGDFDAFAACFALPQQMDTFAGRRLLETRDDLSAVFDAVRAHFARSGVTDLVRRCVHAAWIGPDEIEGMHETRLLAGTQLLQAPFPVLTRMRRIDGVWKIVASGYAISDSPRHNAALTAAGRRLDEESDA
jgi:hypothetical protein